MGRKRCEAAGTPGVALGSATPPQPPSSTLHSGERWPWLGIASGRRASKPA